MTCCRAFSKLLGIHLLVWEERQLEARAYEESAEARSGFIAELQGRLANAGWEIDMQTIWRHMLLSLNYCSSISVSFFNSNSKKAHTHPASDTITFGRLRSGLKRPPIQLNVIQGGALWLSQG